MPKSKSKRKEGKRPFVSNYRRKRPPKIASDVVALPVDQTRAGDSLAPVAVPVKVPSSTPSQVVAPEKQEPQFPKVRRWRDFGELIRALNNARDNPESPYYLGGATKR